MHFLRAIGVAMSMRAGIAADAAAALLFRILSQPALLFPPLRQVEGVEVLHEDCGGYISSYRKQVLVINVNCRLFTLSFFRFMILVATKQFMLCSIWAYKFLVLCS